MYGKRRIYRRNRKIEIAIFFLFLASPFLHSQDNDGIDSVTAGIEMLESMESWLLYEKGIHSFDERNYGEALNFFNKLVERHGVYPEAEYWIGRVFEQEGEFILAEKQYLKALEAARILHIPEEKYEILYRLAELYKNRENFDSYSQILNSIVLDELEENPLALANEQPAINTLKRDGIDRMLLLFRHRFTYSVEAFNQLGIYHYKSGNYRAASSRLIYPLLSYFSIAIDYIRERDPRFVYPGDMDELMENHSDYVFDTLEKVIRRRDGSFSFRRNLETLEVLDPEEQFEGAVPMLPAGPEFYLSGASCCLRLFKSDPVLAELTEEYEIFRTMYYLGASLYAEGYSETAARIWEIVYNDSDSGMWGSRSYEQLVDPEVEIGSTIF